MHDDQPDDTLESDRRWPWLEHWFALRWRAVLTWVALAGMSGAMLDTHFFGQVFESTYNFFRQQIAHLGLILPGNIQRIVSVCNVIALFTWFQPVALRLNLMRSLIWFGVSVITGGAVIAIYEGFFWRSSHAGLVLVLVLTLSPAMAALSLIGWRTRPWMSILGSALSAVMLSALIWSGIEKAAGPAWLALISVNLPYALVMIYGTKPVARRLLPLAPADGWPFIGA